MKEIFDRASLDCSKKITLSYSTSFSLGIRMLNKKLRDPIYAIYGFVRLADEIVDSFHDYNKNKLLNDFRSATVNAIEEKISLNPILNSFQKTVKKYSIQWPLIDVFLESMEYDLDHHECDESAYKNYIKGSAEAVGLMCLCVFTDNNYKLYKKLEPYAVALGSAFQKINFLRDIRSDHLVLKRVYFPNIDIKNFNTEEKKKIEKDILKDFDKAIIGIRGLPTSSRLGVYLAYVYYFKLFKKIEKKSATQILQKRIRINNFSKFILLTKSILKCKLNLI